ncbi:MAG: ABC transporter permease [Candidatus Acidiferrales bacterium]
MQDFLFDLRYGARMLLKKPGFTLATVLTLALGIGSNTAIFSTVNALLLRPFTFPQLDQLVLIQARSANGDLSETRLALAEFLDLRSNTRVFEQIAAYRFWNFNFDLTGTGEPEGIEGYLVSPNFFDLLGVRPTLGSGFLPENEEPGRNNVVLLSYGLWQQKFGADPEVVGKAFQINGRRFTISGVMPKEFRYPLGGEMWAPLPITPGDREQHTQTFLLALGRIKPGSGVKQAQAELDQFAARWAKEYPRNNTGRTLSQSLVRQEQYKFSLPLFLMLQAAAGFVLLLAGANVASLLLARAIEREKEIAVRTALGASRWRLLRLFVCESTLIALVAAVVAAAVSFWGVDVIRTSMPAGVAKWVAGWSQIRVDARVLSFTLALAVFVGILFAVFTASRMSRREWSNSLREGGATGGPGRHRVLGALVVMEMTAALVLLVGAGLMAKGFIHLADAFSGLEPASVVKMEIALPHSVYADDQKIGGFLEWLLKDASVIPGVQLVAVSDNIPANNADDSKGVFSIAGRPALAASDLPSTDYQSVSPAFFRLLHIPVVRGRVFGNQDGSNAQRVGVINETMARRFWPKDDPIGRQLKLGASDSDSPWLTIVGIVGDVKQNWWDPQPRPTLYLPYLQAPQSYVDLVARTSANGTGIAAAIRSHILRQNPLIAAKEIQMMDAAIADSIAPIHIIGTLMIVFGVLALVLAAVGVYGILAHSVAERTHEIGIRMALGAQPRSVLGLILRHALKLAGIGLAIGLPIAFGLSRVMASQLFGIVALNPSILAGIVLVLIVVAALAGLVPAWRASRVDPMIALRME